jgi:hypothetical protein
MKKLFYRTAKWRVRPSVLFNHCTKGVFSIFFLLVIFPSLASAASSVPAGLQNTLWFSKDPFVAGETVLVFAQVYNSGPHDLSGAITLFHGTTTVDVKPFRVSGEGGSQVVSFPFLVTPGPHVFSARLSKLVLMGPDSSLATIDPVVIAPESGAERRTALPAIAESLPSSRVEANLLQEVKDRATTSVAAAVDRAYEKVPAPVASRALPVLGGVESFRREQSIASGRELEALKSSLFSSREVSVSTSSVATTSSRGAFSPFVSAFSSGALWKTPLQYVELFGLIVWEFLVSHAWLFYGLILFICYRLIRTILGIIF